MIILFWIVAYLLSGVGVMIVMRHFLDSEYRKNNDSELFPIMTIIWPFTLTMFLVVSIADALAGKSLGLVNFVERITRPPTRTYKD